MLPEHDQETGTSQTLRYNQFSNTEQGQSDLRFYVSEGRELSRKKKEEAFEKCRVIENPAGTFKIVAWCVSSDVLSAAADDLLSCLMTQP